MKLISWNIGHRAEPWRRLLESDADVALLQEATEPPHEVVSKVGIDAEPWLTEGAGAPRPWRTAVVQLTNRVRVEWLKPFRIFEASGGDLAVSRLGTLSAAKVIAPDGKSVLLASMYGLWEKPHSSTGSSWIYADASVHRVISDLAGLIGQQNGHNILAAGDLNILHGYGEGGNAYWGGRYATVFARMSAMGVPFVGPQAPNGRRADPWPTELPPDSANVPTFYTTHAAPETAARQLDFVFASVAMSTRVRVRALNAPDQWGPSDHCRVEIEID